MDIESTKPQDTPSSPSQAQFSPETDIDRLSVKSLSKDHDASITTSLSPQDVHDIFAGAPQFTLQTSVLPGDVPRPLVIFPWDQDEDDDVQKDYNTVTDPAWKSECSASQTRDSHDTTESQPSRFETCISEKPCMSRTHGLEKGTYGYRPILELEVADDRMQGSRQVVDPESPTTISLRHDFLKQKEGLRPITQTSLTDRLINIGDAYGDSRPSDPRPTIELYTELFTQVLYPPLRVTDQEDPFSLQTQIEAIVSILAQPHLWIDLTCPEWRTRFGQVLWEVGSCSDDEDRLEEAKTQRYWLLLQILLSCELLTRLDLVVMSHQTSAPFVVDRDVAKFRKEATPNIWWSLILARNWLENIRVTKTEQAVVPSEVSHSWFDFLTGTASSSSAGSTKPGPSGMHIEGSHCQRQLAGLVRFAVEMQWPNTEALKDKVAKNTIKMKQVVKPLIIDDLPPRSSRTSVDTQQVKTRARTFAQSENTVSAVLASSGWLSNLYLSGLTMPGSSLSLLLMSTLLENDEDALSKLGADASLNSGFTYKNRSFWSTRCIVGRILAPSHHSSECMGWISSTILPSDGQKSWINIKSRVCSFG